MSGFAVSRFVGLEEWLSEDLLCYVCQNVCNKAIDTQCSHTFCSQCIQTAIRTNGFRCPQCQQQIGTRKWARSAENVRHIVEPNLYRNYKIDAIIGKLKINCDFELNGCSQVIQLALMDSHLKTCHYKYETIVVNKLLVQEFPLAAPLECLMFGTYRSYAKSVEFNVNSIRVMSVKSNRVDEIDFRFNIMIPFTEIQQLMYCSDPTLPVIIVKPSLESNAKFQHCLGLGEHSTNGFKFDVNSKDPSEQYIIIRLMNAINDQFVNQLIRCIAEDNNSLEFASISVEKAKQLVDQNPNINPEVIVLEN